MIVEDEAHGQSLARRQPGRIPVHLTNFIGRRAELSSLQTILKRPEVRLLTLTGAGGSGKTRLAARLAAEIGSIYEDGVCWVELADLTDPNLVTQDLVTALDVGDSTTVPSLNLIIEALQRRQILLVLDNCEHLLDACAQVVAHLLANIPDLHILATSRELLNIPGEVTWVVSGMSLPETPDLENPEDVVAQLSTYDAIAMFVTRASYVLPSFKIDASNAAAIWKICRQLDGMPLALELAAARLRSLGVEQILERVRASLDLLAGSSDLIPIRQRSLRVALEWSYDLLTEAERVFFYWLAVFRGSFSLEAAESLVGEVVNQDGERPPFHRHGNPAVDLLSSLVDKSLVVAEREDSARTTYRLLETIRAYAQEKLAASGQERSAKDAHLDYYHRLAQEAAAKLRSPDQQQWVARLETENDNLRAALGWAVDQGRIEENRQPLYSRLALEMAGSLFWFWSGANYLSEGLEWLEQALALPVPEEITTTKAFALWAAGSQAWLIGDFAKATIYLKESLSLSHKLEDSFGIAACWMMLGRVHLYQGDAKQALKLGTDSVHLFQELDAQHERGLALGLQSAAAAMLGDFDPARRYAREMLEIFKGIGDPYFTGLALIDLGWAAYHQGDLLAAEKNLQAGFALSRQVDGRWLIAQSLNYLAEIARFQGEFRKAGEYIEESLALAEEVGAQAWLAQGTRNFAYVSLYTDRPQEAAGLFLESLGLCENLGDRAGIALALQGLAAIAADQRAWSLAEALANAAAKLPGQTGSPRTPAEREDQTRLSKLLAAIPVDNLASAADETADSSQAGDIFSLAQQVPALFEPQVVTVEFTASELSIYALGPTQVLRDGKPITAADWGYAKPRELFFYLVANKPLSKAQIGLDFWPDASPAQLRRNFRAALYRLRKALGRREWILFEGARYAFNRQLDDWYDVEAFEEAIAKASQYGLSDPDQAAAEYSKAIRLYRGDFLEDVVLNEWALPRQEELRQSFHQAHLKRAGLLVDKGLLDDAADDVQRVLAQDNLMEAAHQDLMRIYSLMGDRNRALRHYLDLRQLLADELGVEPAPETQALYRQIQSNRFP